MITVTNRDSLRMGGVGTARFEGADHRAGVSFFWVDTPRGGGPNLHRHPYTETWVVLEGEADIAADGERIHAMAGDILTVTAGTVHQFRCTSEQNLKMVCIHASSTIIQEFIQDTTDA